MTENNPLTGLNRYELTHLVTHLTVAGRMGDVHRLLALERKANPGWLRRRGTRAATANAWHQARESTADATGYLADIALARSRTDDLGLDLRYALVEATVGGLNRKAPPELVHAMVTAGLWTTEEGISRAVLLSWPDRARAVAGLAARLPERDRAAVLASELAAAADAPDPEARAVSLAVLGPEDFGPVLDAVELIRYDYQRAEVLVEVACRLPADLAPRAADIAGRLTYPVGRAEAVAAVVPLLRGLERHRVTLDLLESIDSDHPVGEQARDNDHVRALSRIAGAYARISEHLDEPRVEGLLDLAWDMARAASDKKAAARFAPHHLSYVAPYLEAELRSRIAVAAFGEAGSIRNRQDRVRAMCQALPLFAEEERGDVAQVIWAHASSLRRASGRISAVSVLVPYLPEPARTEAGESALADLPEVSGYQPSVRDAIVALAPHLPADLVRATLRAPWTSDDEAIRAEALTALLPHLPPAEQRPVLTRIAQVIDSMSSVSSRGSAWSTILRWPNEPFRSDLTAAAMKSVLGIRDHAERVDALAVLAPHLDPSWAYRRARTAARLTVGAPWRSNVFAKLAFLAPDGTRAVHVAKGLALARRERDEAIRCGLLAELAAAAARSPLVPELLAEIGRIGGAHQRLRAYQPLVPLLDAVWCDKVMPDVLAAVDGLRNDQALSEAVCALAGCFPASSLPAILGAVRRIGDVENHEAALAALVPRLSDDAALAEARSLRLDKRVPVLALLAPRLPDGRRSEAVEEAVTESAGRQPVDRALLLAPLLPWISVRQDLLAEALRPAGTPDAVTDVLLTLAAGNRDALSRLAPRLGDAELDEIQQDAAGLDVPDARVEVVAGLARHPVDATVVERGFRLVLAERSTREELVAAIARLTHVIAQLGGESAAIEVARAIVEIGRWWR